MDLVISSRLFSSLSSCLRNFLVSYCLRAVQNVSEFELLKWAVCFSNERIISKRIVYRSLTMRWHRGHLIWIRFFFSRMQIIIFYLFIFKSIYVTFGFFTIFGENPWPDSWYRISLLKMFLHFFFLTFYLKWNWKSLNKSGRSIYWID